MNQQTTKLSYDEIDKLLETFNENWSKDINLKLITEDELDLLLKTH